MANICFSTIAVSPNADKQTLINAYREGFTINDEKFELPFLEEIDELIDDIPYYVAGTTNWALDSKYIFALSTHLNHIVGCTNLEEGQKVYTAEVAYKGKHILKELNVEEYEKKYNAGNENQTDDERNNFFNDISEELKKVMINLMQETIVKGIKGN